MASKQGKGARARAKRRRDAIRRSAKAARKALYKSYAESGQNSKSTRFKRKTKAKEGVRTERHAMGDCGNIGCGRCNPGTNQRPKGLPRGIWRATVRAWEKVA